MGQVLHYAPDIACLQEVDRLSDHLPSLTLTHDYTSFVGYSNKKHGILIAAKRSVFKKVGERGIRLDDMPLIVGEDGDFSTAPTRVGTPAGEASAEGEGEASTAPSSSSSSSAATPAPNGDAPQLPPNTGDAAEDQRPPDAPSTATRASRRAAGISRVTRNVGLFVALEFKDQEGKGVIVGSTHLFWSGDFVYERTRQTAILYVFSPSSFPLLLGSFPLFSFSALTLLGEKTG
jgi:RNA exonuclease NGL2